jgi:tRNA (guanine26-N2/guanine27-N2)-dimethyltransferase
MAKEQVNEGKIVLGLKHPKGTKIHKKVKVFYNPVMKFNRDVSLLLLDAIEDKKMNIALPLCASGIRGLRMLKELKKSKINSIHFNDLNKDAIKELNKSMKINKIKNEKIKNKKETHKRINIHNKEANQFMIDSNGFDYIDLDPFGSPNRFLDQACCKLSRNSILAVTATDTSALTGTYLHATERKYWSISLRNEMMHETGIRILIRRVQLIGAEYDRALTPIYSYFKDHYFRIFFRCEKGRRKVDDILHQHKYMVHDKKSMKTTVCFLDQIGKEKGLIAGPLWVGKVWDKKLAKEINENRLKLNLSKEEIRLLDTIKEESITESRINKKDERENIGFLDLHKFGRNFKKMYSMDSALKLLKKNKIKASRTHFSPYGIRCKISGEELNKL